jgi:ATP-binding cassette subfamily F protein uup
LGEIEPDSGEVKLGTKLSVAYFDQFRAQLDDEATVAYTISQGGDYVEIGGERKHVISYLEDFLFAPERARSPVKSLSGGERNRLLLARLFTRPANILVLDEPTNDLDIDTLELLESLLQDYPGTVLLVSHDRTFLDNVVTQVIAFEGNGVLREYAGGYEDWVMQRAKPNVVVNQTAPKLAPTTEKTAKVAPEKTKLSWKEQQDLAALPMQIEMLEIEQERIMACLADPNLYVNQKSEAVALQAQLTALNNQLEDMLVRWEALEAKA